MREKGGEKLSYHLTTEQVAEDFPAPPTIKICLFTAEKAAVKYIRYSLNYCY